jgi:arylsulfatase A-like enzyme
VPPPVHNVRTHSLPLRAGLTTLAGELRQAGYHTAGITSTPATAGKFGFSRGFAFYDDWTITLGAAPEVLLLNEQPPEVLAKITSPQVTRLALRWLNTQWDRDQPFFLHLFYYDPHYDYVPPEPYDQMFTDPKYDGHQDGRGLVNLQGTANRSAADKAHIVALHDGEIRFTDDHIKTLLEELKTQGLLRHTIVMVVGDHGEEFWEHGGLTHGHTLYEELLRIPLIVRYPPAVRAGLVVKRQVGQIDIMPTLLELAGVAVPAQCLGRSLVPLLGGNESAVAERAVVSETEIVTHLRSIRTPTQKMIEQVDAKVLAMYDLAADPGEHNDLSQTERAKEFQGLAQKYREWNELVSSRQAHEQAAEKQPEIDPRLLRQLKSLGYVK